MDKQNTIFKTRSLLLIIFVIAMIILSSNGAKALGVTPGLKTIDYASNLNGKYDFSIINSEKKNMNIVVYVQGELNQSIYLSDNSFFMKAEEESKQISYEVRLNDELSPGIHSVEIVVMELPEKSLSGDTFVGTAFGCGNKNKYSCPLSWEICGS